MTNTNEDYTARKAECLEVLHVVKRLDGFHVEEFDAETGAHVKNWPGPFKTRKAAELFMDDLASAAAGGNPYDACCSDGIFEAFEEQAAALARDPQAHG